MIELTDHCNGNKIQLFSYDIWKIEQLSNCSMITKKQSEVIWVKESITEMWELIKNI